MRRLKVVLQYDGTRYSGWQRQDGALTVQETLEKILAELNGRPVAVQGASRTDAGVHALGQTAHFDDEGKLPVEKYLPALNALLPEDIAVTRVEEAPTAFHARFDALSKWYRYRVLNQRRKEVFGRDFAYQMEVPLDIEKMRQGAAHLIGEHDFTSFKTLSSQNGEQDPVRTVSRVDVIGNGNEIHFDIEGNGFLYKMVRGVVGSLIEVGRGRFEPSWIAELLLRRDRTLAGPNAPAHGLCLMEVRYKNN